MKLKQELEKLVLAWWYSKFPISLLLLESLRETDFTDENRIIFQELTNPKNETQEDLGLALFRRNREKVLSPEWMNAVNVLSCYSELYISNKIEELIRVNNSKHLIDSLNKAVKEYKNDAVELANYTIEVSQNALDIITQKLKGEDTQYIQSRQWFEDIDRKTEGFIFPRIPELNKLKFEKGHVIAINGIFKNGKTTLALALGFEQEAQGKKFAYISAEMTPKEINSKFFAYKFDIMDSKFQDTKFLGKQDRMLIEDYIKSMAKNPLFKFEINTHLTLNMVHGYIRRMASAGIDFIVIDYYQKIFATGTKYKNREEELSFISSMLKTFALKYDVCLCVVSQMNRGGFSNASAGNAAGALGLNRDADFLFNIYKPSSMLDSKGKNNVTIDGSTVYFDKHDYMLNLEFSRHSMGDAYILLTRTVSGRMETKWQNMTEATDYFYTENSPF